MADRAGLRLPIALDASMTPSMVVAPASGCTNSRFTPLSSCALLVVELTCTVGRSATVMSGDGMRSGEGGDELLEAEAHVLQRAGRREAVVDQQRDVDRVVRPRDLEDLSGDPVLADDDVLGGEGVERCSVL